MRPAWIRQKEEELQRYWIIERFKKLENEIEKLNERINVLNRNKK